MTQHQKKKSKDDVLSYLKKVGIARDRGGAFYEYDLRLAGSIKAGSIKFAGMINKAFKAKESEVISVRRRDLPLLLGNILLVPPEKSAKPRIKQSVKKYLRDRGIEVVHSDKTNIVDFRKIPPKKY